MRPFRTILLVGAGNMGFALLRSWQNPKDAIVPDIHVVDPSASADVVAIWSNVTLYRDESDLPLLLRPDVILFAIKPQLVDAVLPVYARHIRAAVVVSIMAGITIGEIERHLGSVPIVRALPNTPASIGKGSTIIYANDNVNELHCHQVALLFAGAGSVHHVEDEQSLDMATALSGSGPAYVFYFIECLTRAAICIGLKPELADVLAKETVLGSACLALASEADPTELRRRVTSPNGTTMAAISVLSDGDRFQTLLRSAVKAAHSRAIELGSIQQK